MTINDIFWNFYLKNKKTSRYKYSVAMNLTAIDVTALEQSRVLVSISVTVRLWITSNNGADRFNARSSRSSEFRLSGRVSRQLSSRNVRSDSRLFHEVAEPDGRGSRSLPSCAVVSCKAISRGRKVDKDYGETGLCERTNELVRVRKRLGANVSILREKVHL